MKCAPKTLIVVGTMLSVVTTHSADDALAAVVAGAGASLVRDAVDTRILETVLSYGTTGALLDSQDLVGGWPELDGGTAASDSDRDGMPDGFEEAYGLNKDNANDRNDFDLSSAGYTNLEVYLSALVAPLFPHEHLAGDYNNSRAAPADW